MHKSTTIGAGYSTQPSTNAHGPSMIACCKMAARDKALAMLLFPVTAIERQTPTSLQWGLAHRTPPPLVAPEGTSGVVLFMASAASPRPSLTAQLLRSSSPPPPLLLRPKRRSFLLAPPRLVRIITTATPLASCSPPRGSSSTLRFFGAVPPACLQRVRRAPVFHKTTVALNAEQ